MALCTKGSFVVFHEDLGNDTTQKKIRNKITKDSIAYLSQHIPYLDSPTYSVRTEEAVVEWFKENPWFKINPKGYFNYYMDLTLQRHIFEVLNSEIPQGWQPSQIGIWSSNLFAWKKLLETDFDYVLMLEDDLILEDNFWELFTKYMNELPDDWDVYYHFRPNPNPYRTRFRGAGLESLCLPFHTWSHAGYAISRKGAERIVSEIENGMIINYPVDWLWLRQETDYVVLTPKPFLNTGCRLAKVESSYFSEQIPRDWSDLIQ
jgi:hypothetical protein